jgi:twinkle protein
MHIVRPLSFADVGIVPPAGAYGEIHLTCPRCSHTRRKRTARCLSVNTINQCWCCHHCGWTGALGGDGSNYGAPFRQRVTTPAPPRKHTLPKAPPAEPLPVEIIQWFANRSIPESILHAAGITGGQEFCPQLGKPTLTIRFPYLRDGRLINLKYRALCEKAFWMHKGAERILYGPDEILDAETIAIVEGEVDKLSIDTAGGPSTVSVPDGAPSVDAKHYAGKFAFLDETALDHLTGATSVLIGTDMDVPGEKLADELARRIGYARCKRVSWSAHKDANEMLVAQGPAAVRAALASAQQFSVPRDDAPPPSTRPVRNLPPSRGRRPILELVPGEVSHAR